MGKRGAHVKSHNNQHGFNRVNDLDFMSWQRTCWPIIIKVVENTIEMFGIENYFELCISSKYYSLSCFWFGDVVFTKFFKTHNGLIKTSWIMKLFICKQFWLFKINSIRWQSECALKNAIINPTIPIVNECNILRMAQVVPYENIGKEGSISIERLEYF